MSTVETGKIIEDPAPAVILRRVPEIRIFGHSMILYWWPVWVAGYVMAAITYSEGSRAAVVPPGTVYDEARHSLVLPAGSANPGVDGPQIGELAAKSKDLGVVFTIILLLVVFITNTPLRGLWAGVATLLVAVIALTFACLGIWPQVIAHFGRLRIHMNMGFYMFFSTLLLILWASVVFGFDRMHYWKFRPGQLTYESSFGGGQKSYDTTGMLFEKLRSDPFRHWLLGMGSGDLVLITSGAQREHLQIPNVLLLNRVLRRLQTMVSERPD